MIEWCHEHLTCVDQFVVLTRYLARLASHPDQMCEQASTDSTRDTISSLTPTNYMDLLLCVWYSPTEDTVWRYNMMIQSDDTVYHAILPGAVRGQRSPLINITSYLWTMGFVYNMISKSCSTCILKTLRFGTRYNFAWFRSRHWSVRHRSIRHRYIRHQRFRHPVEPASMRNSSSRFPPVLSD